MQISKAMKYIALQISDAVSRWAGWATQNLEVLLTPFQPGARGQIMPTTFLLAHPDLKP